jgi:hypothetical protein
MTDIENFYVLTLVFMGVFLILGFVLEYLIRQETDTVKTLQKLKIWKIERNLQKQFLDEWRTSTRISIQDAIILFLCQFPMPVNSLNRMKIGGLVISEYISGQFADERFMKQLLYKLAKTLEPSNNVCCKSRTPKMSLKFKCNQRFEWLLIYILEINAFLVGDTVDFKGEDIVWHFLTGNIHPKLEELWGPLVGGSRKFSKPYFQMIEDLYESRQLYHHFPKSL